jgi:hypothetical protein
MAGCFLLSPPTRTALPKSYVEVPSSTQLAGLTKEQAEHTLDWLENQGRTGCSITCDANGLFSIQLPAGVGP